MLALLLVIIAFSVLLGAALFYYNIINLNIGESFVLSAVTLIAVIYISGLLFMNLQPGRILFCCLGVTGFLITFVQIVRGRFQWKGLMSLYLPLLFLMTIFSVFLFRGVTVTQLDELHYFALAQKYMLVNNRLPIYDDFVGGISANIGTCIFHNFFQSVTGYNESVMYVSAALLSWTGMLLPVSNRLERRQHTATILYVITLYFAVWVFYKYGFRNIMVDVPTAGWLGGLAGWSLFREKKRQNIILIASVMWVAYPFKDSVGLVLDAFFLMFFIIRKEIIEKKDGYLLKNRKVVVVSTAFAGLAIVTLFSLFYFLKKYDLAEILPGSLKTRLLTTSYSFLKVEKTLRTFINRTISVPMASINGRFKISCLGVFLICILLFVIYGYINNRLRESLIYICYSVTCAILYYCFTLSVYLFMWGYSYSINAWDGPRYLSICVMYLFILALSLLLLYPWIKERQMRLSELSVLILLLVFVYGVRGNSLYYNTSLPDAVDNNCFKTEGQRKQALLIRELIGTNGKVYFLNQKADRFDEFERNGALYYMSNQINNLQSTPWKYEKEGALIRHITYSNLKINDFPQLLDSKLYTHVWIYKTDSFLNSNLPNIMSLNGKTAERDDNNDFNKNKDTKDIESTNPANIIDGQLYKIIFDENGTATGLKLVDNLVPYDNRIEHRLHAGQE